MPLLLKLLIPIAIKFLDTYLSKKSDDKPQKKLLSAVADCEKEGLAPVKLNKKSRQIVDNFKLQLEVPLLSFEDMDPYQRYAHVIGELARMGYYADFKKKKVFHL